MEIPPILKKPPVIIGAVVLVVIILVVSRKNAASGSSASGSDIASANAAIAAQNQQSQIAAGIALAQAQIGGTVSLANIEAQRTVALAKISADENVNLSSGDYQYAVANKQLENNRILGLTQEDTKRLISTQTNQTAITLGTASINAQLAAQANQLKFQTSQLESNERINDLVTSRALTFQQITGANQIAAIQANKPSWFQSLMGGLGGIAKIVSAIP